MTHRVAPRTIPGLHVASLQQHLFSTCLAASVLVACHETPPVVERVVVVQAAPPLVQDVGVELHYPVELQADEAVSITPVAISGFLRRVLVDVGDEVEAGQLIALVDCREYSAKRTQAETMIAKRKAQVEESSSQLERLNKLGEGMVAPAEIDRAQADKRVAEAELADAKAKLSEAGQRQGYCSLTAPFGGFVTDRYLDAGAMVSPGGQPVVRVVKSRDVRVVASVIEEDAPKVKRDAMAEVVLHAFPDNPFHAKIARIGRALDPGTRTLRVEMEIPKSTEVMLPGMTGRASIVIDTREKAMLVPFTSVLKLEETAHVYVVREDEQGTSRTHRVEVELGVDLGDWVEVTSGLTPTDKVVYTGRELVDDGTEVEVSEPTDGLERPETSEPDDLEDENPPGHEAQAAADAEAAEQAEARAKRRAKAKAGGNGEFPPAPRLEKIAPKADDSDAVANRDGVPSNEPADAAPRLPGVPTPTAPTNVP